VKDFFSGLIMVLIVLIVAGSALGGCYIVTWLPLKNGYCQTYIQPNGWSGSGTWVWQPCRKVNP
jgi:hypothetical protein